MGQRGLSAGSLREPPRRISSPGRRRPAPGSETARGDTQRRGVQEMRRGPGAKRPRAQPPLPHLSRRLQAIRALARSLPTACAAHIAESSLRGDGYGARGTGRRRGQTERGNFERCEQMSTSLQGSMRSDRTNSMGRQTRAGRVGVGAGGWGVGARGPWVIRLTTVGTSQTPEGRGSAGQRRAPPGSGGHKGWGQGFAVVAADTTPSGRGGRAYICVVAGVHGFAVIAEDLGYSPPSLGSGQIPGRCCARGAA